jgi:hypothetical protein
LHPSTFPYTGGVAPLNFSIYWWVLSYRYFTNFFLYKNMTVVLLLHPKINCMTIPPVVPVKICRTILYRKHFAVSMQIVHLDREKSLSPCSDNHWIGYRYFGKCFITQFIVFNCFPRLNAKYYRIRVLLSSS